MISAADLPLADRIALVSGQDVWHTRALPEHGVPAARLSDGPHGLRVQFGSSDHLGFGGSEPSTCFPPAVTLASAWDEDLAEQVGQAVAREAHALGVAVVLGPGLNIKRHPLCGRNFEYFSEDPLLSGRLAAAVVEGLQGQGVGACLKHFAVNNQESHRFVVDAIVDERTLRELYLAGFEHAVTRARPWTVMAAYNSVNGHSCTEHDRLLTAILRDEWGFDGLVMSDWGATRDRVEGLAAGMDLEMPSSQGISDARVAAAIASGHLPEEALTTSAQRVLDLVHRTGSHSAAARVPTPASTPAPTIADLTDTHDALARQVAAEGTVLLQNDGLLPLAPGATVALIGAFAKQPRYQGSGSSLVVPTRLTTAYDALVELGVEVSFAPGYDVTSSQPDPALIAEAVGVAAAADVAVVMVGLPDRYESEGFDRDDLALPRQHDDLVRAVAAANPRTVVALSNGAPVLLPWRDRVAAIVESYLGGQASGGALADVLLGVVEPGGRLAESFPTRQQDVACDPYFPGDPHQVEHREGLFVGYRHLVTAGVEPAFPFGHGLGYTTFEWGPARLDREDIESGDGVRVTLTVTNTGTRDGSDVVQVYLHDRTGVVLRPRRWLAEWAKVRLAAGASTEVTLDVAPRAFAFWDVRSGGWQVPSGTFDVEVARSSVDVAQVLSLEVRGGVTTSAEPVDSPPITVSDHDFARRLGHPVPTPRPVRPFTWDSTMDELSATRLGRGLRAILRTASGIDKATVEDESTLLMVERSINELPLRAAALFSDGKLSWTTVDLLLAALNKNPRDGLSALRSARSPRASGPAEPPPLDRSSARSPSR